MISDRKEPDWRTIETAPFDRDVALAVIESGETHALAFACRRTREGWSNAATGEQVDIHPTHWRSWPP